MFKNMKYILPAERLGKLIKIHEDEWWILNLRRYPTILKKPPGWGGFFNLFCLPLEKGEVSAFRGWGIYGVIFVLKSSCASHHPSFKKEDSVFVYLASASITSPSTVLPSPFPFSNSSFGFGVHAAGAAWYLL
jgi:hypothetical protein